MMMPFGVCLVITKPDKRLHLPVCGRSFFEMNMYKMKYLLPTFLELWLLLLCHSSASTSLRLVIIVHRHGIRAPLNTYANDPYRNDSYWPEGWGQLTTEGKSLMYHLGQEFRNRYKGFLTDNPREVFVRSSSVPRCLESAALLLAGLYPPNGSWVWNKQLDWQPFPIETVPQKIDGMLNPDSDCPMADKEFKQILSSKAYKEYNDRFKDFFQYLSVKTGQTVNDLRSADTLTAAIEIEKILKYKLPKWINDQLVKNLTTLNGKYFYFRFSTKRMQKLKAGLLINQIRKLLKNASEDSVEDALRKKLYIFSSHDTLLTPLLSAFGAFDDKQPTFGSSVVFELHAVDKSHHVKVYYHNQMGIVGNNTLKLAACDHSQSCSIEKFIRNTEDLTIDDWKKACHSSERPQERDSVFTVFIIVIVASLIALFGVVLCRRQAVFGVSKYGSNTELI